MERLNFAKVCVEIPTDFMFAKSLQLNMGESAVDVNLEYPRKPAICTNCRRFGDKERKCPNVVSKVLTTRTLEKGQASCVRDEQGNPLEKEIENIVNIVNIEPQATPIPTMACEQIGGGNRFEVLNEVEDEHEQIPQVAEKLVTEEIPTIANANAVVEPTSSDLIVHTKLVSQLRPDLALEIANLLLIKLWLESPIGRQELCPLICWQI
ncbi:hypothetical protein FRX31_016561 [Thalictrum thalictroides]|uniref:Zinc knuckle (CCHC-type) family protein n=1 Tax=Thalictrum thalictroides TaxID=46969 RepID=A0A7J6WCB3_THATH|nr:hypothetical protein FRX31_016561 [Thalictrum thalictroides]